MTYPRLRLAIAAGLFVAWLGFLAYLVFRTRDPVILSRPQLLVSHLVVIAEVGEKNGAPAAEVTIKEILRPAAAPAGFAVGTKLTLAEIGDCGHGQGWRGAGDYIVPLQIVQHEDGRPAQVTALPLIPGRGIAPEAPLPPLFQLEIEQLDQAPPAVHAWLAEYLHVPSAEVEALAKKPRKSPWIIKRNLTRETVMELRKQLEKLGARISPLEGPREGEYRIYRATADARAQVE